MEEKNRKAEKRRDRSKEGLGKRLMEQEVRAGVAEAEAGCPDLCRVA